METKLNKALIEFKKQYPGITSADLQTFILGWQSAKKVFVSPELLNIAIKCLDWCNNAKSPEWVNELRKETEQVIKKATE